VTSGNVSEAPTSSQAARGETTHAPRGEHNDIVVLLMTCEVQSLSKKIIRLCSCAARQRVLSCLHGRLGLPVSPCDSGGDAREEIVAVPGKDCGGLAAALGDREVALSSSGGLGAVGGGVSSSPGGAQ